MVDCRSLIEFCRAFEQHRRMVNLQASMENRSSQSHVRGSKMKLLSDPFCEHSPFAAMDFLMLLLVLGSIGVLTVPYFKVIYNEASELLPVAVDLVGEVVVFPGFVAYATGFVLMLVMGVVLWAVISHQLRKCGNPKCRGLQKAVEFDIQLESEECIKFMSPMPKEALGCRQLELEDDKELEAELRKMAPLNGRTVLIFRSPCGCPIGRMEVWGQKKVRRIKK